MAPGGVELGGRPVCASVFLETGVCRGRRPAWASFTVLFPDQDHGELWGKSGRWGPGAPNAPLCPGIKPPHDDA